MMPERIIIKTDGLGRFVTIINVRYGDLAGLLLKDEFGITFLLFI